MTLKRGRGRPPKDKNGEVATRNASKSKGNKPVNKILEDQVIKELMKPALDSGINKLCLANNNKDKV